MVKRLIILTVTGFTLIAVAGRSTAGAETKVEPLTLEQQVKIGQIITNKETRPLRNINFGISLDGVVPQDVHIQALPADVEALAPQFRGAGYIVIEEQIAIVDQPSRKIIAVLPRGRAQ